LNSRKLPDRFSYGLGTTLVCPRIGQLSIRVGCVSVHIVTVVVVEFALESTEKMQDISGLVPRSFHSSSF